MADAVNSTTTSVAPRTSNGARAPTARRQLRSSTVSRAEIEAHIEFLIEILDRAEPDPDLEDDHDLEDCCDDDLDADFEPCLGSPEGALGMAWGAGGSEDLEQDLRASRALRRPFGDIHQRLQHEAQETRVKGRAAALAVRP